jgi:TolA-binding protein
MPIKALVFLIASSLLLAGCFLRPPGLRPSSAATVHTNDTDYVPATNRSTDSLATLDAQLEHIDSLKSTDSASAELFQLTLENYLGVAPKDPKSFEIKLWLGNHLFTHEHYDSAMVIFQDLLKSQASSTVRTEASQMVAQTYVRLGDADKAQAWFQERLQDKDSSTSKDARDKLAQALYVQGENAEKDNRLDEAAKYYGDVTRAFPGAEVSPIALYNCGVLREKLGDWKRALAAYTKFTDLYYTSPMLPRVLFRQAKSQEMLNDWVRAADSYLKLAQTYPNSEQAEPALYNAGFAYANAKLNDKAATAFESYSTRLPQATESPNLLFRAVEIRSEMQQWEKVTDLQNQFQRRYGNDRNRAVQAACLGGLAAYHQNHNDEAKKRLSSAVEIFKNQSKKDAQSRVYAAQSQFTMGEILHQDVIKLPLRDVSFNADLDLKTTRLKYAAAEYLKVIDYRIAEWALRAAHALGLLFENYGRDIYQATWFIGKTPAKTLERAVQNLETEGAAWVEAVDHYSQAEAIAQKQGVHDRYSQEAATKPPFLRSVYVKAMDNLWINLPKIWPIAGLPGEKAVSENMEKLTYLGVLVTQADQVSLGFEKNRTAPTDTSLIKSIDLDSAWPTQTLALRLLVNLGHQYRSLIDTVRSVKRPNDSMEAFFFQIKLIREGLAPLEKEELQVYEAGIQIVKDRKLLASVWADSLKSGFGEFLFRRARSYDLLGHRALANPPINVNAPTATKHTFETKFEELGYQLQDQAFANYKDMVNRAKSGQIDLLYAELALIRLFESQPDAWSLPNPNQALLPLKPWDGQSITTERLAFLKTLEFPIPHLNP